MLLTSYISDKYVPGILIGYVTGIENDSNRLTKSGYVVPVVDFGHLEEVLVITQQKKNYEQSGDLNAQKYNFCYSYYNYYNYQNYHNYYN